MKESLLKREINLDALADEIVELIANSKKLTDILKVVQENEIIQKKNLSEVATLKNRITILENRLNNLVKSFRIDIVEAERMVSEKTEKIIEDSEQRVTHLTSQIEDLRDMIVRIGNDVKKLKEFVNMPVR
ncbi:MAG: hypothetical protein QXD72_00050 [Candidatus Aenigmatarchaeota archaeon]